MSLSAWIVLGLIAGLVSSNIVNGVNQVAVMDAVFGYALLIVTYYAVSRYTAAE
jgi:uncharacterized membrane protein YeaQ/YmgE (transglycosylase-associated protein family)